MTDYVVTTSNDTTLDSKQYTLLGRKLRDSVQAYRRRTERSPAGVSNVKFTQDSQAPVVEATLLKQIFSQIPVSLYIKDTEARHLFISKYDIDPEDVIGKTDLEVYGSQLAESSYQDDLKVINTGNQF